jgi:hypothetical protein
MDVVLAPVLEWADGKHEDALERALAEAIVEDPAHAGALRVLGRLADKTERKSLARACYALLVFLDPADPAAARLQALGAAATAAGDAMRVGGPADHAGLVGPVRRALAALAPALLGFGTLTPQEEAAADRELRPARAGALRLLGNVLGAPAFGITIDAKETEQPAITVLATRPPALRISAAAADLPERTWEFMAGRALEELRSGLAGLRGAAQAEVAATLAGARAALTNATPQGERAQAVARWLGDADPAASLPGGPERKRLVDDLEAVAKTFDWDAFLEAAQDTANRVGLLACGSPTDALGVLAREDLLLAQSDPGRADARRGFVRTGAVRELVRFMLSPEYEQALGERQQ